MAIMCSQKSSWEGTLPEGLCFTIAVGARFQLHLSDYQMGSAVLPSGSSVLSFPVTVGLGVAI